MTGVSPLERVLALDPGADLRDAPIDEIRALRAEAQRVEVEQSYLRRLVQGRVDIVAAELRHREQDGEPVPLSQLVDELPDILADHVHAPGQGRLSAMLAPADPSRFAEEVDRVVDAGRLGELGSMADDELRDLVGRLTDLEREVSARRRELHRRIDALQAELTRRYKTGEATVESLLP